MKIKILVLTTLASGATLSQIQAQIDITTPGDTIVAYTSSGDPGSSPGGELVANAIDNNVGLKYLNFDAPNDDTGFIVTPSMGSATGGTILTGARFATANDSPDRDPITFTLEGANGGPFALIFSGDTNLFPLEDGVTERNTFGTQVNFANSTAYTSYRVLFTTTRTDPNGCCMQVAEAELIGTVVPEPSTLLFGLATLGLAAGRRRR